MILKRHRIQYYKVTLYFDAYRSLFGLDWYAYQVELCKEDGLLVCGNGFGRVLGGGGPPNANLPVTRAKIEKIRWWKIEKPRWWRR